MILLLDLFLYKTVRIQKMLASQLSICVRQLGHSGQQLASKIKTEPNTYLSVHENGGHFGVTLPAGQPSGQNDVSFVPATVCKQVGLLASFALCLFLAAGTLASLQVTFISPPGSWQQGHLSRWGLTQRHTLPRRPARGGLGSTSWCLFNVKTLHKKWGGKGSPKTCGFLLYRLHWIGIGILPHYVSLQI